MVNEPFSSLSFCGNNAYQSHRIESIRMPKARLYLKNAVLFVLITALVFVLQTAPFLHSIKQMIVDHTGGNWLLSITFFLGAVIASFLIKVEREEESKRKALWGGILFVCGLYFLRYGPLRPNGHALLTMGPYYFFGAFLEEFFFRRVGYEGLRKSEEKFWREPTLKRLGPISLLLICVIYGTVYAFNPWHGGAHVWDWNNYARAFDASARYCLLYVATRSIWVPGTAHFLTSITGYLW